MEVTFWGVRGSIPATGPGTVRYGGNTSCVTVLLESGALVIIDCGTGARNLGLSLREGPFGRGKGHATILLSHGHWDHIQGFPFFLPLYVPGNVFEIHGGAASPALLEQVLEGQMAAQFFPVQSFRNMGATVHLHAVEDEREFRVGGAKVRAHGNPHGPTGALAFRIEDAGRVLVYASDAGYATGGADAGSLALYRDADLLIHDSTYTPEDRALRLDRGLSSFEDALDAAARAGARKLALFHYDQDYSDHDVDEICDRARRAAASRSPAVDVVGAAEGLTLRV